MHIATQIEPLAHRTRIPRALNLATTLSAPVLACQDEVARADAEGGVLVCVLSGSGRGKEGVGVRVCDGVARLGLPRRREERVSLYLSSHQRIPSPSPFKKRLLVRTRRKQVLHPLAQALTRTRSSAAYLEIRERVRDGSYGGRMDRGKERVRWVRRKGVKRVVVPARVHSMLGAYDNR